MKSRSVVLFVALCISACSDKPAPQPNVDSDPVLARVGNETISRLELDVAIDSSIGPYAALHLGPEGEHKVLQSLVMRKLMSQHQFALLDEDARTALELQVNAYREELLTKQFVREQLIPEPVTEAMVTDYYQRYPEEFGAAEYASYQLLRADTGLNPEQRQRVLWYLEQLTAAADWTILAEQARQEGLAVYLVAGTSSEQGLIAEYQSLIAPLAAGQVSATAELNNRLVKVKVLERNRIAAKPLADVSDEIRKKLAPMQLKRAIEQATDNLKANTDVEIYPTSN
ncbi:peptidyl-prolyl cis-trans isomerase [Rheinheimera nanhaiensis]|uniref:PpiC-type peptidyl-prolyl cis-trans isomerase n=1 Tax=Rheinheimera nanhaiensis E407-8 TaxID=562729 RepID=I1DZP6_9GAMM|nr:peptidylprolyl isomerase [Rheinheimera nanhaiensis]GAB59524.1 PpiC-type peptidyl-prolyl cis-trans isomerase [Rheinheimera nanhaiensis E407-8]